MSIAPYAASLGTSRLNGQYQMRHSLLRVHAEIVFESALSRSMSDVIQNPENYTSYATR